MQNTNHGEKEDNDYRKVGHFIFEKFPGLSLSHGKGLRTRLGKFPYFGERHKKRKLCPILQTYGSLL